MWWLTLFSSLILLTLRGRPADVVRTDVQATPQLCVVVCPSRELLLGQGSLELEAWCLLDVGWWGALGGVSEDILTSAQ